MNPYIIAIVFVLGIWAGHAYTIEEAKQGSYQWCKL